MKGKHNSHRKGSNHHRWNHQKLISVHGYVKIRVGKTHPLADPNGYAYEHLVVWVSAGKRLPKKNELLHHEDEDKKNNRLENLGIVTRRKHNTIHNKTKKRDVHTGRFLSKAKAK